MFAGVDVVQHRAHRADGDERCGQDAGADAAAGHFYAEHQAGERDAGEHHAADVEVDSSGLAYVLDEHRDQHDAEHADRHVDVEDPAPVQVGDDEAADRWAEDGSDRGGDHQPGHRGDEFGFGHRAQQHETPDGDHHRTTTALQHARADEERQARRLRAHDGADGEQADRGTEHGARAEAVRDLAAGRDEHGQAQQIGRQCHVHAQRINVEGAGHGRQGGGEHGAVQLFHEERAGNDQGRGAGAGAEFRRGGRGGDGDGDRFGGGGAWRTHFPPGASSIIARIFAARSSIAKGLVMTCMPGSRWPWPTAALSA